ncbi:hypothetical protein [Streptomyces sp. NBC_01803]|uniref:hypothetical protein n=1 Tax=Streptomyces sp. NBC_01803 TaxID=2975946 RepID=UPI002DDBEFD3|nr:hypothetical protein [Streptomyces sp. NBC_01803]WSA43957.1 hypothetical protein OIE51_06930 [Streptomyces sp. NBC_01803]
MPEPVRRAWERGLTTGRAALTWRCPLRATAPSAAGGAALAACGIPGTDDGGGDAATEAAEDRSAGEKELALSNWPLSIDVDEAPPSAARRCRST